MIVAFDVDGTLIDDYGNPYLGMIRKLKDHYEAGDVVLVWSWGGVDHIRQVLDENNLWQYVHGIFDKADVLLHQRTFPFVIDIAYDDRGLWPDHGPPIPVGELRPA